LFDSRAICRFIVAKNCPSGSSLLPTEIQAWALFEQAASVEQTYFDWPANVILDEKFRKR
jgi:glutathione S-transferase